MSIFGSIMSKIFHSADAATPAPAATPDAAPATGGTMASPPPAGLTTPAPAPASQPPVDVEAVLTQMASQKGGGGNWQTSIVDLLKLLDLDSSLTARKELGTELSVHDGADGTAEQNVALHKAVMKNLADNGGKVSATLRG